MIIYLHKTQDIVFKNRKEAHMFDRKRLQAQMVLKGITGKEMAARMGINEGTLYRKMGNDGDFSRSEITKIMEILDIEDPSEIFFAEQLA
jgi:transcriptional regulator with XRE-family HTH domain